MGERKEESGVVLTDSCEKEREKKKKDNFYRFLMIW
jgi:hypothetical protein